MLVVKGHDLPHVEFIGYNAISLLRLERFNSITSKSKMITFSFPKSQSLLNFYTPQWSRRSSAAERGIRNAQVRGSNPRAGSIFWELARWACCPPLDFCQLPAKLCP